jgi:hypothetical protein
MASLAGASVENVRKDVGRSTKNVPNIPVGYIGYGSEETASSDDSLLASDDTESEELGDSLNREPDLAVGPAENSPDENPGGVKSATENEIPLVGEQDVMENKAWKLFMVRMELGILNS